MSPAERIQKILADRGLASRRKAEEWIREGRVTVNGKTAVIGEKADPGKDAIKLDGRRLSASPEKVYVLFYKPRRVVTTLRDPEERTTVMDLVAFPNLRLFPVGRLDFDAEGLILLTNDGGLAQQLTHPSHEVPRTYWVKVKGKPEKADVQKLIQGIRLEDGVTAPCTIAPLRETEGNTWVEMVLREGRNRQVKRMWEKLGYPVLKLKRVGFGGLKLGDLQPGEYRLLGREEVRRLKARAASPPQETFPHDPARSAEKEERRGGMMQFSKKGDGGFTSLLGGQRVPKCSPRPEVYGTLDEAASALGIAKACAAREKTREVITRIQRELLILGAELATAPEDRQKFPGRIEAENADSLEGLIAELQSGFEIKKEFILPGETLSGAAIDLARAMIRRAERNTVRLFQEKVIDNGEILRFLNRLADLLFVLARYEETR